MSGIAGFWNLDGRPADRGALAGMTEVIAHRGPDATASWCQGSVGIGHRMLYTTPESLNESMPQVGASGNLVLTADARIDNRQELIAALGLRERPQANLTDSELILGAYERWGEECPEHLLGDFAFVIWDATRQRLFCARDRYGVKPLYFHRGSGRLFAFASEIKALLVLPGVPREPNEVRIGYFLARMFEDRELTFYQGISRLPPAHSLVVTAERSTKRCYWSLDPEHEIRYGSDDEYAEAFREIFYESVRCRVRSAFPVGSTLSGGLDSSSITCVAGDVGGKSSMPSLHTISHVFDEIPGYSERPYIDAVLERTNLVPHFVAGERVSPLEDGERYLWHLEEPNYAHNLSLFWAATREAARNGLRVVLTGLHGDNTVLHGEYYLADLLRTGRWVEMARLLRQYKRNTGRPLWRSFKQHALLPLTPTPALRLWRRARHRQVPTWRNPIRASFASEIHLEERRRRMYGRLYPETFPGSRHAHHMELTAGLTTSSLEVADRVAAAFGTEVRHPFLDSRLVEFCLALPAEQKFLNGWPRSIIRRALAEALPPMVRDRISKTGNGPWYLRTLSEFESDRLDRLVSDDSADLERYVDRAALRSAYDAFAATGDYTGGRTLWEPLVLKEWLDANTFGMAGDPQTGGGGTDNKQRQKISGSYRGNPADGDRIPVSAS